MSPKLKLFLKGNAIRSFTPAAFLIGSLSFLSSVLGMLRDRILASTFGAGSALDIYYAAFRLPDLVFNIFIFGALSSAFVPIFSKYLTKNKKEAFQLAGSVLNLALIIIFSGSIVCIIFAPLLLQLIVPGFEGEKLKTTIDLTRIMFLSPILLSISGVFSGILTTFRRFFVYSLAPIMYNLGIIAGIYILTPRYGIYGLAFAVVAGAFLHLLIQMPGAIACGYKFKPGLNLKHDAIRSIGKLMVPRSLSLLINQVNLLIITGIASTLMAGSLAVFYLANNLAQIPLTLFGAPFAVAVFPDLAASFNRKRMEKFVKIFSTALIRISFFVIPVTVVMLTLRSQLVRIILGTGEFDWQDTKLTFEVLGFLSLSLFFQSIIPLVSRAFFALHNTIIPFISGGVSVILNIFLAYFLSKPLGIAGVALAFSISQAVNAMIMFTVLYFKVNGFENHKIVSAFIKVTFGSVLAGIIIQAAKHYVGSFLGTDTFFKVFIQAAISASLGGLVFVMITWYLGLKEVKSAQKIFLRWYRKL